MYITLYLAIKYSAQCRGRRTPRGEYWDCYERGNGGGDLCPPCLTDIDPQLIIYSLNARIHAGPAECGGDFERRLIWSGFLFPEKNVANQFSVTGVCPVFTVSTRCRIDGRVTCLAVRDLPEVPTPYSPTVPPQCQEEGPEDTWRTRSRSLPGSTGGVLVAQASARARRPPQHDVPCLARAARHAAICGGQFVPWWGLHSYISSPQRTLKLFNPLFLAWHLPFNRPSPKIG